MRQDWHQTRKTQLCSVLAVVWIVAGIGCSQLQHAGQRLSQGMTKKGNTPAETEETELEQQPPGTLPNVEPSPKASQTKRPVKPGSKSPNVATAAEIKAFDNLEAGRFLKDHCANCHAKSTIAAGDNQLSESQIAWNFEAESLSSNASALDADPKAIAVYVSVSKKAAGQTEGKPSPMPKGPPSPEETLSLKRFVLWMNIQMPAITSQAIVTSNSSISIEGLPSYSPSSLVNFVSGNSPTRFLSGTDLATVTDFAERQALLVTERACLGCHEPMRKVETLKNSWPQIYTSITRSIKTMPYGTTTSWKDTSDGRYLIDYLKQRLMQAPQASVSDQLRLWNEASVRVDEGQKPTLDNVKTAYDEATEIVSKLPGLAYKIDELRAKKDALPEGSSEASVATQDFNTAVAEYTDKVNAYNAAVAKITEHSKALNPLPPYPLPPGSSLH